MLTATQVAPTVRNWPLPSCLSSGMPGPCTLSRAGQADSVGASSLTSAYAEPGVGRARTLHLHHLGGNQETRWHCQSPAQGPVLERGHCPPRLEQGSQAGQGQVTQGPAEGPLCLLGLGLSVAWGVDPTSRGENEDYRRSQRVDASTGATRPGSLGGLNTHRPSCPCLVPLI